MSHQTRDRVFRLGGQVLPGIWRDFLPEAGADLRVPGERYSTCDSCPKVACGDYLQSVRCCTYFPRMPNFMVGHALLDSQTREAAKDMVARGHALPSGFHPTPSRFRADVVASAQDGFGKDESLRCPLLDSEENRCRVHAYRNSVCSTYFCEHDHGEGAEDFWDALQEFIGRMEIALGQWVMAQAGLDPQTFAQRLDALADDPNALERVGGSWSERALEHVWADLRGSEIPFFERCAHAVDAQRDELWNIARQQSLVEPLAYDAALRESVPAKIRHLAPEVSEPGAQPVPLAETWYLLGLKSRRLWELPFGEGPLILASGVYVDEPPPLAKEVAGREEPFALVGPNEERRRITAEERALVSRLEAPTSLDERFFDTMDAEQILRSKRFLAECVRRGVLIGSG